jgi:SAM-dependent methyltransferase
VTTAAEAPVWKRIFIAAHVVRLRRRAPREVSGRWEQFWVGVRTTGDGGDVLWDASDAAESSRYLDLLAEHADLALPVVDVGCGNGRFTRALAGRFPSAVGVDLSPAAVALATAESAHTPGATFLALDMTEPGAGHVLRRAVGGDVNVFVRGVLHVLDVPARRRMADNIATLVGARGRVLIGETNHRGHPLRYLERLGAGPRGLPSALARAISTGIPAPSAFGDAELEACFPRGQWRRLLVDADAAITTIPLSTPQTHDTIPGYVAVLAPTDRLVRAPGATPTPQAGT